MPASRLKARLDVVVWVLIYLGLFAIVLGIASRGSAPSSAWALVVGGAAVSAIGVVLIWVRSRLDDDA
ncbi:MAG: hypothetical protein JWQ33_3 [Ramlibacter sp.]|nr:hypothetical protein [Ramlibacter sp.]